MNLKSSTSQDYYPFGMLMPTRTWDAESSYRFGFNKGSEREDELTGNGNSYSTYYRLYDARLARWWSVDPKADEMALQSVYNSMDCNPILHNDPLGDKIIGTFKEKRALRQRADWSQIRATYRGRGARDLRLHTTSRRTVPTILNAQIQTNMQGGTDGNPIVVEDNNTTLDHLYFSPLTRNVSKTKIFTTGENWHKKPRHKTISRRFISGTITTSGTSNNDGYGPDQVTIYPEGSRNNPALTIVQYRPPVGTGAVPLLGRVGFNFGRPGSISVIYSNPNSKQGGPHGGFVIVNVTGQVYTQSKYK